MPRRVLITREHAAPLEELLREGGMQTVHVPLVSLQPTGSRPPAHRGGTAVITSAAVARFLPDLTAHINGMKVAAVGRATQRALEEIGVHADVVGVAGGRELIEGLRPEEALLYIGASAPSEGVVAALMQHKGRVERWSVYDNVQPSQAAASLAEVGEVDLTALTSPSAAWRYSRLAGPEPAAVAVLGATTAAAARTAGLDVAVCSEEPGLSALAAAILEA